MDFVPLFPRFTQVSSFLIVFIHSIRLCFLLVSSSFSASHFLLSKKSLPRVKLSSISSARSPFLLNFRRLSNSSSTSLPLERTFIYINLFSRFFIFPNFHLFFRLSSLVSLPKSPPRQLYKLFLFSQPFIPYPFFLHLTHVHLHCPRPFQS